MAEFSQLIKKFDKIRDYMRDFYVYGFKSRSEFTKKSARTYDNEKRRCESYLGEYMKWDYKDRTKSSFVSVDCGRIPINPLYAAWKSKSFTSNDIMLHFYISDILHASPMSVEALTDEICQRSGLTFDVQTVRGKCSEYVKNGILTSEKQGKAFVYSLFDGKLNISEALLDAVSFFQGSAPFGEVGSYILDRENKRNGLFSFKHNYIAHTLEDGVLLELLAAIRKDYAVYFENHSEKSGQTIRIHALPLKIFVSTVTGRRFICMYSLAKRRFANFRLDYVKTVELAEFAEDSEMLKEKLDNNLGSIWGVGFGGSSREEIICMKLFIDEKREQYIIDRIKREGQGGELVRLEDNIFLYTKTMFDSTDMSPWIKTFTGRIIQLEGTNRTVINRFYGDMNRMAKMYDIGGEA